MKILGFDWDEHNQPKVESHELTPEDIEWLFEEGDPIFVAHPDPRRRTALGFVPDGTFVLVVFEYDKVSRWVRVITAYPPTHERWWRLYERHSGR